MNKYTLAFITIFLAVSPILFAQDAGFKGVVYSDETRLPIAGADVEAGKLNKKTGKDGRFILSVPGEELLLVISHPAYDTLIVHVNLSADTIRNFYLRNKSYSLNQVTINGDNERSLNKNPAPTAIILSKKDIQGSPGFLGQADPIRTLQTLPGSGKGGEGNSGLYIRGGTSGQNLTVFNGATIYNPSHLLGFFSVFNSASVAQVGFHKSGIPAEFGGRLSSIIELNSSKKIADSLKAEADVSIIALNSSITVPVTKNWSVSLAARKTFMNTSVWPLLEKFDLGSSIFKRMKYDFFDLNFNSNMRLSPKDYVYLSAYSGGDNFGFDMNRFNISNLMNWYNRAFSGSWRRFLNNNVSLNTTASYSNYDFSFGMNQDKYRADIKSGIRDYSLKTIAGISVPGHSLKAGLQFTNHVFRPNTPYVNSAGTVLDFGIPNTYFSDESSVFLSDQLAFSEKLSGYAGLRFTYYRHRGPYTTHAEDGTERSYRRNKKVSSYTYLEPSFSLRYAVTENSAVKLSLSANTQPVHLISVTAVNFPADFWMPSLKGLSPQKGYQGSLGYFKNFAGQGYESYVDLYYKNMDGLTEFSGGIMNLLDNLKIEEHLFYGKGKAYGAEFYLKKREGKLTGWLGYTLSKSERNFPAINNGRSFPAKYDRRHDASIVAAYKLSNKWSFTASFTYATGNAYTRPTSRYLIAGNIVNEYGAYNGGRIPPYHRADAGALLKLRSSEKWDSSLSFSVYNVYNRQNPVYLFFLAEGDLSKYKVSVQPKSVALLPVLPSVSYKVSFK